MQKKVNSPVKVKKTFDSSLSTLATPSPDTLLPTSEIIDIAKKSGVDFGNGNPLERIRYFIKLQILPHAVRKAISSSQLAIGERRKAKGERLFAPTGHLPYSAVSTLIKIQRLYQEGLSYPQIAQKLKNEQTGYNVAKKRLAASGNKTQIKKPIGKLATSINFFPTIGVSEKNFTKKLKDHENNLSRIIDKKLGNLQPQNLFDSNLVSLKSQSRLSGAFKILVVSLTVTGLASAAILSGKNYYQKTYLSKNISEDIKTSSQSLGEVLAASSADHRLYIDADTDVSGLTVFAENITAPNVLYGATGGTGINVSAGQTPTISLDSAGAVTSVNTLAGGLTISGSGATSISASGSTITISSTDTSGSGDITAVSAGNGLSGGGSSGDVSLAVALTSSGTTTTTSSVSGLQFSSGLSLLRGCTNSQVLAWVSATATWDCTAGGGSFTSFTLSGDTGTDQTISDTNTLEVAGGTNGIDTVGTATDTITLNLDTTEIGTTTFGTGSSIVWTFNAGTTDPQLTFGDNALTIATAATITATDVTAFNCTDCLDFDDFEDTLDLDTNLTINQTTSTWSQSFTGTTTTGFTYTADSLTTGKALDITSISTAGGASGTSYLLNISRSGTNSNSSHTAYGLSSSVTNTGTGSSNVAAYLSASGATTSNYALYAAAGNLLVADGNVSITSTSSITQAFTLANNSFTGVNLATIASTSLTGGNLLSLTANGLTTGSILNLTSTSVAGGVSGSSYALNIARSGTNSNSGHLAYGLAASVTNTGGTSTNYGIYASAKDATTNIGVYGVSLDQIPNTVNTTNYGVYGGVSNSVEDDANYTAYGVVGSVTKTGDIATLDGSTLNYYGGYFPVSTLPNAPLTGIPTLNSYGGYFSTTGNTNGTSTGYGIYSTASGADTNYGGYFTTSDSAAAANTDYGLYNLLTLTGNAAKVGFGQFNSVTSNSITADTLYGLYGVASQTGANTTGTKKVYGIYGLGSSSAGNGGSSDVYGAIFNATGDTSGTGNTYGIYATASGGDTNYSLFINASDTASVYINLNSFTTTGTNIGTSIAGTITKDGSSESYKGYDFSPTITITTNPGFLVFDRGIANNPIFSVNGAITSEGYIGIDNTTNVTGATSGTATFSQNVGLRSNLAISLGSATSVVVTNHYGLLAVGPTVAASTTLTNSYGVYIDNATNSGTLTNHYGVFIENMTAGGTLDYGIYIAGADTSTIYSTQTSGTTGNIGLNLNYTASATGSSTQYGIYSNFADSAVQVGTSTTNTYYGNYGIATKSGADNYTTTGGTTNIYGFYSNAQNTSTDAGAAGTRNTYAGYFTALGASAGTTAAYGIYATASGGDTNYSLFINASDTASVYINLNSFTTTGTNIGTSIAGTITKDGSSESYKGYDFSPTITITTNPGFLVFDRGILSNPTFSVNGAITSEGYIGIDNSTNVTGATSGTATFSQNIGFRSNLAISLGSATSVVVTNHYGLLAVGPTVAASTTLTNSYGVYIDNATNSGTLTNHYGVFIENMTAGGTLDYGIYIAGADTYGIFVDAGTSRFDDSVEVGLGSTASTTGVCSSLALATTPTAGTAYQLRDCSGTPAADYMELYSVENDVEPGEIVVTSEIYITTKDGDSFVKLKKSIQPYQSDIIGVASNPQDAGDFNSIGYNVKDEDNPKPVALNGRVTVKVTDEGGPIQVGNLLTSSSIPGVAMKADPRLGSTIGKALQSFDCNTAPTEVRPLIEVGPLHGNCQGKIIMFVETNTRYNLAEALRDMDLEANTLMASNVRLTNGIQINQSSINEDGTLNEEIRDAVLTAEQVRQLVQIEVERQLANYQQPPPAQVQVQPESRLNLNSNAEEIDSPIPGGNGGPTPEEIGPLQASGSAAPEATSSSQLAQETNQTLSAMNDLLSTTNLQLDTLTVTSQSNLAQTYVAGTFAQDGTLIIDYGRQINVLGSTLYLQNDPLAGSGPTSEEVGPLLVDIGAGKVTIDANGNLKVEGELKAKRLTTGEIAIDTTNQNSQTVGSATIGAGTQQINIQTTALKPDAKILITATTKTFGKTLYIAGKTDFEGFTVAVDSGTATSNISFDWFILNVNTQAIYTGD